jgi:hypothetical protein
MKRALLVLCLAVSALPARAGLWEAVCAVESGGNALAVGDRGADGVYRAAGIAQIWAITVKDVNRFAGTRYTLNDRFNVEKSRAIFQLYVNYYGKGKSDEVKARIWNGGPNAMKATGQKLINLNRYWAKIKKHL